MIKGGIVGSLNKFQKIFGSLDEFYGVDVVIDVNTVQVVDEKGIK